MSEKEKGTIKYGYEKVQEELKNFTPQKTEDYFAGGIFLCLTQRNLILIDACKNDEAFNQQMLQSWKSWKRCMKYVYDKIKKKITVNELKMGCSTCTSMEGDDEEVMRYIREYYALDDKEQVEKEIRLEKEKKQAEKDKKAVPPPAAGENATSVPKPAIPKPSAAKHKKKAVIQGQMSFF